MLLLPIEFGVDGLDDIWFATFDRKNKYGSLSLIKFSSAVQSSQWQLSQLQLSLSSSLLILGLRPLSSNKKLFFKARLDTASLFCTGFLFLFVNFRLGPLFLIFSLAGTLVALAFKRVVEQSVSKGFAWNKLKIINYYAY